MAELKQIEVNGTTYDIGIAGSECPFICETFSAGTHWSAADAAQELHDKHFNDSGTEYTYTALDPVAIFIRTQADNPEKTIVIAVPEESE